MERFVINGGSRLEGSVDISGAKNAAVAILPAVIVSDGICRLDNVPKIRDIELMTHILSEIGADVRLIDDHSIEVDAGAIDTHVVSQDLSRHMRASYYFIGALISKFNRAMVSLPGGCNLGARPIDQHLKAFAALGCNVAVEYGMISVECPERLRGAHIFFDTVSVGATINAMLAAVKAEGQTILENVAREPHVVDTANFLNSMGADIRGAGTDVIKVRGVSRLGGAGYSIMPDQIEAGTYMAAAAVTGGDVLLKGVIPKHLESITSRLRGAGAEIIEYDDSLRVRRGSDVFSTNIKTSPYPGFPTDMMPQMSVLLSMASGTSIITESIWDNRFKYVDELRRMGARIQVDGKVAVVEGIQQFTGAVVRATDLRAGAAMIIAGLAADGVTVIEEIYHIDRGYEDIVQKLRGIGADIKRVGLPDEIVRQAL